MLFHDHRLHGTHVTIGVIFLIAIARKVWRETSRSKAGLLHEPEGGIMKSSKSPGLYWHFVDLVWVFIFAFFYLCEVSA